MLEASRFTIEKQIKPILKELERKAPTWNWLIDLWCGDIECGFCREWDSSCEKCPLYNKVGECYYQEWYYSILKKLYDSDLTVYGDIIDVWYCYENLEEE